MIGSAKNTLKYQTVAPGIFILLVVLSMLQCSVPAGQEASSFVTSVFHYSHFTLRHCSSVHRLEEPASRRGWGPCVVWLTPLHLQLVILERTVNAGVQHPYLAPAPQAVGRIERDRSTCSMLVAEPGSCGHSVNDHLSHRSSIIVRQRFNLKSDLFTNYDNRGH